VLHCSEIIPIAPYIEYTEAAKDPHAEYPEGQTALETLQKFLAEGGAQ
jgi:hypothetical protein